MTREKVSHALQLADLARSHSHPSLLLLTVPKDDHGVRREQISALGNLTNTEIPTPQSVHESTLIVRSR